ncbi:MAG TPA: class I SAM-dependent methyltransferase [Gaiellales bacterium]
MNAERRAIAAELLASGRAHDKAETDRLERFRNVETETAELLAVLVRSCGARRILELGTSNGYSTIWLADAAEAVGGAVTSIEIDPARTALAQATLARAGLGADLVTGDAGEVLRSSAEGAWDMVFLDAERPAYAGYWPDLKRVLRPGGGLLAIDNVLSHAAEVAAVTALIEAEAAVATVLVPIGAGLRLVVV